MYKKQFILFSLFFSLFLTANAQTMYRCAVDLTNVKRDKIKVTITLPDTSYSGEVIYVMPVVVPGSYALKTYGRFIDGFTAYDKNNKKLKVSVESDRDFIIKKATDLNRIEYWVNDTWDDNSGNPVFQSGGSNIEEGKNFAINNFAFFGYVEGMSHLPYEVVYTKPESFYASTYLRQENKSATEVKIVGDDYNQLADNPVMFCIPDTTSFEVNGSVIYISTFSVSGKVKSDQLKKILLPLMEGMNSYLEKLPVDQYHFIFYFASNDQKLLKAGSGLSGFGALEHKNCSFYYLSEPEYEADLEKEIPFICSHEFLHTLTPLNLHSREIESFNYRFPEMSQHLWLYEGVTEYFSLQALVKSGIISEQDFLDIMSEKMQEAAKYPLFSMTEMSKNVLLQQQQDLYLAVYSKGALLAWLLDIKVASMSKGYIDVLNIVQRLKERFQYGGFNDNEFVMEFIYAFHPDLQPFFDDYITGKKTINYEEMLKEAGYLLLNDELYDIYKSGPIEIQFFPDQKEIRLMNENINFGFLPGDVLKSINGNTVGRSNIYRLFDRYFVQNISPDSINLVVTRNGTELKLSAVPQLRKDKVNYIIVPDPKSTEEQLIIRKKMLGSN